MVMTDDIAQDGMKLARKVAAFAIGLAGVGVGISLAIADIKTDFVQDFFKQFEIEISPLLSVGLTLLLILGLASVLTAFAVGVKNPVVKGVFLFGITVMGSYLLVRGFKFVYDLITGKMKLSG